VTTPVLKDNQFSPREAITRHDRICVPTSAQMKMLNELILNNEKELFKLINAEWQATEH
jgi:hypothetical protein